MGPRTGVVISEKTKTSCLFETDLFMPIIMSTEKLTNNKFKYDSYFFNIPNEQSKVSTAFK